MRKFIRWVLGADEYMLKEIEVGIRLGVKSVERSMRECIDARIDHNELWALSEIKIEDLLVRYGEGKLDQAARDAIEKQFTALNEAFIDSVVERIARKQLK